MKNIVCPSCGSEKVTILENEKAVCLSCDSIFNIRNYSKEFEKTSLHIDEKAGEIIEKIENIQSRNNVEKEEYKRFLEKAQVYIKLGDKTKAIECAKRAIEIIPEKLRGYIELYRIWTNNYELVNCYSTFLNTEETEIGNYISDTVRKALICSGYDPDFVNEVVNFQKRCAQCALSNIEVDTQKAITYRTEETSKYEKNIKVIMNDKKEKEKKIAKDECLTRWIIVLVSIVIFGTSKLLKMDGVFVVILAVCQVILGYISGSNIRFIGGGISGFILLGIFSTRSEFPNIIVFGIVDFICLCIIASMVRKKVSKKRNIKIDEIELDAMAQMKNEDDKYGKSKKIYEERMRTLTAKKNLYNRILADMQYDRKVLLNNYINKAYRI